MAIKDWGIWNYLKKWYGENSYNAAKDLIISKEEKDSTIRKRHPSLSWESLAIFRLLFRLEEVERSVRQVQFSLKEQRKQQHRGTFRVVDENGDYIKYYRGDIVNYDNKTYLANKNISSGMGPLHEDAGWKEICLLYTSPSPRD